MYAILMYFFPYACKTLKRILRNMPFTLTYFDQGPPILKKKFSLWFVFVEGRSPPIKPIHGLNFFFFKFCSISNIKKLIFFQKCSDLNEIWGMCCYEGKINFPIFFSELWSFLYRKLPQFSMNFHNSSKNRNRKIPKIE